MCIPTTYYCIEHRDDPNAIQIMNNLCGQFTHNYFVWSYSITNDQHYIIARKKWCSQHRILVRINVFIDFLISLHCHTYTIKYKIYPQRLNISFQCHLRVEQCFTNNSYPIRNATIHKAHTHKAHIHKAHTHKVTVASSLPIHKEATISSAPMDKDTDKDTMNTDKEEKYPTLTIQRLEALNKHLSHHTVPAPTWADMVRQTTPK
jgi:hypothetical protein